MKRRVAVLGAGGLVGQRFVSLLARHPWFSLEVLTGSERSVGLKYGDTVEWAIEAPFPEHIKDITVLETSPDSIVKEGVEIAFSALPAEIAQEVELELVKRGVIVISNASNMRLDPDVPLLNPEVNADHIEVLEAQRRRRGWSGAIVKVPNCTTAILTLSLKPLLDEFGVKRVIVSTMQAVSGAGLKGLAAMAILDNIIPYIEKEEEKVEKESLKILGFSNSNEISPRTDIKVSATCCRVPVLEGHTESVFVELERKASLEEIARALEEFRTNKIKSLDLPSKPIKPIVVRKEIDRPQPRLDRLEGNGMSVVVGRLRADEALGGVKYVVLGSNTIRGAAGTGVLIAELMVRLGLA
ncbi:MAG: aspartate-semialdehyde dehydrogenase [Acidilobaceae archaeon]